MKFPKLFKGLLIGWCLLWSFQALAAPYAPSGLSASTSSSNQIKVLWVDNSNNELGFTLQRSASNSTNFATIATLGANVVSYSDSNLSPGTTYYYRVASFNKVRKRYYYSSWSNISSATTGSLVPAPAPSPAPAPAPIPISSANLLFKSNFESGVSLGAPYSCGGNQCLQDILGQDISGLAWPPKFWGSTGYMQLLSDVAPTISTIGNYMSNEIQTVTGHDGNPTRALYQELRGTYGGNSARQDPYIIGPTNTLSQQGDLYTRMWVKFQPDMATKQMVPGQTPDGGWGNWRVLWEWKTGGQGLNWQGDYRFVIGVQLNSSGGLYWQASADNVANSGAPKQVYYMKNNSGVSVPVGQWFKFETFTHRSSGSDGRMWAAVNGQVIADFQGPNLGVNSMPINRIMLFQNYTGGYYPSYQWIDDVEIYDGFPADASSH